MWTAEQAGKGSGQVSVVSEDLVLKFMVADTHELVQLFDLKTVSDYDELIFNIENLMKKTVTQ